MNSEIEIQKLKVFTLKKLIELKTMIKEQEKKKTWLSVADVEDEFKLSRKTFDRMRLDGLKVSQPKLNGKILVEREVLKTFLNKNHGR
ncbi:hypothetical protein ACFQO1_02105 [Jejudonia soesokkakensis]|uniref:Helix-turn-helix domain-containing protein n=1 Tax=Jejudonia soesokkakensis TaxID=1323432 RepID=A0ABW2MNJ7_9FLAO